MSAVAFSPYDPAGRGKACGDDFPLFTALGAPRNVISERQEVRWQSEEMVPRVANP